MAVQEVDKPASSVSSLFIEDAKTMFPLKSPDAVKADSLSVVLQVSGELFVKRNTNTLLIGKGSHVSTPVEKQIKVEI